MSAFTDRLISSSSKDVRLRLSVDGVPCDIEAATSVAAPAAPRIDGRGMLVSCSESRTVLDRQQRLQIGGGFSAVVQDRDNRLRALFAVRSFRLTHLTANVSATATTVPLAVTTALPSSGVVYVAGETIAYTGKTSSTLTGCTRGAYGSRAVAHRGGIDTGASVFTVPPTWVGRRVRLDGYFNDDDGVADLTTLTRLGTYRLEESPKDLGDGRWELRCSHLSDELAKRKIGSGIEDVAPEGSAASFVVVGGVDRLQILMPKGGARFFAQGAYQTHAMVTFSGAGEGVGIFEIVDVDDSGLDNDVLTLSINSGVTNGADVVSLGRLVETLDRLRAVPGAVGEVNQRIREGLGRLNVDSIKHICLLRDLLPTTLARYVLRSRLGTTGGDDALPGIEPTTLGGPGFRFGADIPAAELDTASLEALSVAAGWSWVIDEEIPLIEFLADVCRETETACVFDADGRLVFRPLLPARTGSTTIAEAHVKGRITATVEEQRVLSRVRLQCNYDPVDGEYEGTIDVVDEEIAATYAPVEDSAVIQSRSAVFEPVASGGAGTLLRTARSSAELLPTLRRTMLESRGGGLLLTFVADARHFDLALGADVALAMPSVSDFRGGTLAAGRGRVVERTPDMQTFEVELTVAVEEQTFHWATSAVVQDAASAPLVSFASSTDFGAALPSSVGRFRIGDRYRVYSPVTNVVVGAGVLVVSIISANIAQIDNIDPGSPSLASLVTGSVLLLIEGGGGPADDGFAVADFAWFDGFNPALGTTTRWR